MRRRVEENRMLHEVHNACVRNGCDPSGIDEKAYESFVGMTRGTIHKMAARSGKVLSEADMSMCVSEACLIWVGHIQKGKYVTKSFVSMLHSICLGVYYRTLRRKHRADGWSLEEWEEVEDVGGSEYLDVLGGTGVEDEQKIEGVLGRLVSPHLYKKYVRQNESE